MQQDPITPHIKPTVIQPEGVTPPTVQTPQAVASEPQKTEEKLDTDVIAGEGNKKGSSGFRSLISTVLILLAAPLIAVALTAFVFQSYEVDGQSMDHTLQDHDRLIVWKVPRTISRITNRDYIPKRSDVVIFVKHDLHENATNKEKQLIKRVIGLPGERVVVSGGKITVYNNEHPEGFDPDKSEGFPDTIIVPTSLEVDLVVGEGEVFVCGDNRQNSLDSRSFGAIKTHDIVGRMVLRIFPVKGFKSYI